MAGPGHGGPALIANVYLEGSYTEFYPDVTQDEAGLLRLDSSRARQLLGWQPRWALDDCLQQTLDWHLAWQRGDDMRAVTLAQLAGYWGQA